MLLILEIIGILIILYIGLKLGALPYVLILICALIGFIKYGVLGLIVGVAVGFILSSLMSSIMSLFDVGLIKKKYRQAVARDFFHKNKKEILSLKKFQSMSEEKIIDSFSKYINQIQDSAIKIKDPVKKHPYDLDYAGYKENFIEGGKNWARKYNEENEIRLSQKYVDFCVKAIYEDFSKYE